MESCPKTILINLHILAVSKVHLYSKSLMLPETCVRQKEQPAYPISLPLLVDVWRSSDGADGAVLVVPDLSPTGRGSLSTINSLS